jgi:hypothetical protein
MPAPGVPQSHFRLVETTKSTFGFIASKGIRPAPCVMSATIRLPIARPWATSAG